MKSLYELRSELVGVRISAADTTLWNMGATIAERARKSLNDAIGQYKFRITEVYASAQISDASLVAVLPRTADRIIDVFAIDQSGIERQRVTSYRHVPTPMTNLLYFDRGGDWIPPGSPATRPLEITYEGRLKAFPPEGTLRDSIGSGVVALVMTGLSPGAIYPPAGYLEITPLDNTDNREVIRYERVAPNAFTNITRGVEGVQQAWPAGVRISPVFDGPDEAVPTIMAAAEGNMYHYWLSNRALYDQFTAAAGIQQLDVAALLGMVRAEEDRADRRYDAVRTAPKVGRAQTKKRPYHN